MTLEVRVNSLPQPGKKASLLRFTLPQFTRSRRRNYASVYLCASGHIVDSSAKDDGLSSQALALGAAAATEAEVRSVLRPLVARQLLLAPTTNTTTNNNNNDGGGSGGGGGGGVDEELAATLQICARLGVGGGRGRKGWDEMTSKLWAAAGETASSDGSWGGGTRAALLRLVGSSEALKAKILGYLKEAVALAPAAEDKKDEEDEEGSGGDAKEDDEDQEDKKEQEDAKPSSGPPLRPDGKDLDLGEDEGAPRRTAQVRQPPKRKDVDDFDDDDDNCDDDDDGDGGGGGGGGGDDDDESKKGTKEKDDKGASSSQKDQDKGEEDDVPSSAPTLPGTVVPGRWCYVTIVVDPARGEMTSYVDSVLSGRTLNMDVADLTLGHKLTVFGGGKAAEARAEAEAEAARMREAAERKARVASAKRRRDLARMRRAAEVKNKLHRQHGVNNSVQGKHQEMMSFRKLKGRPSASEAGPSKEERQFIDTQQRRLTSIFSLERYSPACTGRGPGTSLCFPLRRDRNAIWR